MPSQKGLWAKMVVNDVITGISNALYEEFGYENYMENQHPHITGGLLCGLKG